MKTIIGIATHKAYDMPEDSMYLPIQVGADLTDLDLGYVKDNTGENISQKNKQFCELTALYWMWKNIAKEYDYVGLAHYRRHFSYKGAKGTKKERILDQSHLEELLENNNVLLPKKRNYFIESNYSQYIHAHHQEDLDLTKEILKEKYPEYLKDYDAIMKRTDGHRFNMFIVRQDIFHDYCTWLFDILFELEKRLDISNYSINDQRVFGFVGERLLDVYFTHNNISSKDIPYIYMEDVNWLKKGMAFLFRKFR